MKTNLFFPRHTLKYTLIGLISILLTSCGSYQNSSYYDSDGIYGNSSRETQNTPIIQNNPNNQYKQYFSSLQNENTTTESFTDVDNYNNQYNSNDYTDQDYPSWGSNPSSTTINIYSNPWIGYGYPYYNDWYYPYYGYGWGFSGYGGWGYSNYGGWG